MSPRLASFGLGVVVGATTIGLLIFAVPSRNQHANPNSASAVETNASASITEKAAPESFDWRTVESEDYPNYIANLRAIGCPEETIRDIITADVNKLFEDRRKNLPAVITNRFEYWKTGSQRIVQMYNAEKITAQQTLAKERRSVLKTLLGFEPDERLNVISWDSTEECLDFLAPSKRAEVIELEQRHAATSIKTLTGGTDHATHATLWRDLDKAKEAELATLLSTDELEDYLVRRSTMAGQLANELDGFNPTEQEFRAIFRIKKQIEDEFGRMVNNRLSSAATAKLEEELKRLLGDARFADYERLPAHR